MRCKLFISMISAALLAPAALQAQSAAASATAQAQAQAKTPKGKRPEAEALARFRSHTETVRLCSRPLRPWALLKGVRGRVTCAGDENGQSKRYASSRLRPRSSA